MRGNIQRVVAFVAVAITLITNNIPVASAQDLKRPEILYQIELESYFDNREYALLNHDRYPSATDFSTRVMPLVGLEFEQGHAIYGGINYFMPMGVGSGKEINSYLPLYDDVSSRLKAVLYYGYDNDRWSAAMGIFPREKMHTESYSTAFFSDDFLYFNSLVSGAIVQYNVGDSFIEAVCDWQGQPTMYSREKFMILSAARRYWNTLYAGYNFSMTHFAGSDRMEMDNVVDNLLISPTIGARFEGDFAFDISASYLQSMQRDREYGGEWLMPKAAEIAFKLSRWGVSIDENLYLGENLIPFYDGETYTSLNGSIAHLEYGNKLYASGPFFCDDGNFYSRTSLNYERRFFEGVLGVRGEFIVHGMESGVGLEQVLDINVKLGGRAF